MNGSAGNSRPQQSGQQYIDHEKDNDCSGYFSPGCTKGGLHHPEGQYGFRQLVE
jgi:hypothetical protein